MKYVKIYDDNMRQTALADIEQNYDKSGYVKVFDKDMQPIGVMDVDSIPESGANLPFVKVYDENLVMTGVVSVDNIRHSDGYLIKLQKDPSTTGSVSGGGRFVSGTSVTVVATPDAQSEYTEFDGWYEGDTKVSENASYTFTVSGARTLVAKFVEPTPTEQGIESITPTMPSTTYDPIVVKLNLPVTLQEVADCMTIRIPSSITLHGTLEQGESVVKWYKSDTLYFSGSVEDDTVTINYLQGSIGNHVQNVNWVES